MRTDGIGIDIQPNLKLEVAPARWPMLIGGVLYHVQVVAWVQFLAYSKIIAPVYPPGRPAKVKLNQIVMTQFRHQKQSKLRRLAL